MTAACLVCATPLSKRSLERAAKGQRKITGMCGKCLTASVKKVYHCCDCSTRISRKRVRCQTCNNRHMAADPAFEAKRKARVEEARFRPDVVAKHRAMHQQRSLRVLGWCPPEQRAEYIRLRGKIGAAAAKDLMLKSLSPFERQMARVAAGARLVEAFRPVRADYEMTLAGVTGSWG